LRFDATRITALSKGPGFRVLAFIRGWMHTFLIFPGELSQVVDFHDFSRYFSIVADISTCFYRHAWRNQDGEKPCRPKVMRTKPPPAGNSGSSASAQKHMGLIGA
jgi:hypothetical protein